MLQANKHVSLSIVAASLFTAIAADAPTPSVSRVIEAGQRPEDRRLHSQRQFDDKVHPWAPPSSKAEWETEREHIRQRILVSNGLWPMPKKDPLQPVVHGRIDRGEYTVEKVFFSSYPGHYVSGNLYRPKNVKGRAPGVLAPHGHWPNGRFHDAGADEARRQMANGGERFLSAARFPTQALAVQLARMGCVVFHYDMVGMADSQPIEHRAGFTDVEAGLRLQNFMGLQTFNSIRALDFLTSLPDVDPKRIAVTGHSGGGTQTFILCAIDDRPAVSFPAVMVSTDMQGGCICENADYLRHGINNVAIAAAFAPKPMAMTGANDWTINIETRGLPELKQVYSFYGKPELVQAKAFPQFEHNYNCVAREMMAEWLNQHLHLGIASPVTERDFVPLEAGELSVFDATHPRPADACTADTLKNLLTRMSSEQFQQLLPKGESGLPEYRRIVGTAARILLDAGIPSAANIQPTVTHSEPLGELCTLFKGFTGRRGFGEQIPFVVLVPQAGNGTAVLWIDGQGKKVLFDSNGNPTAAVGKLLKSGRTIASVDVFCTGEYLSDKNAGPSLKIDERYAGYTFAYNRPLLSNRVRDAMTALAGLVHSELFSSIELVGTGDAGPWTLLAASVAGNRVARIVVDAGGFSFDRVKSTSDAMYLPGALKYGGMGGLAALAAPTPLHVAGMKGTLQAEWQPLSTVYTACHGKLTLDAEPLTDDGVARRLLQQ